MLGRRSTKPTYTWSTMLTGHTDLAFLHNPITHTPVATVAARNLFHHAMRKNALCTKTESLAHIYNQAVNHQVTDSHSCALNRRTSPEKHNPSVHIRKISSNILGKIHSCTCKRQKYAFSCHDNDINCARCRFRFILFLGKIHSHDLFEVWE